MEKIRIEDLTFEYPKTGQKALENVSFSLEEGDLLCLCGETGCGKTTLLKNLKPVLAPYGKGTGRIYISGKAIEDMDTKEQAEKIGFVMQDPDNQIVTDKVWHELAFGMENLGYSPEKIRRRTAEMAGFFGIEGWFGKRTDELSGGQKQILNLASVMVMAPEILVLDEPTSRLDPIAAGEFLSAIRKVNSELGTTVIISEHRLDDLLTLATKLAVMKEGRLVIEAKTKEAVSRIVGGQMAREEDLRQAGDMMPQVVRAAAAWEEMKEQKSIKFENEKVAPTTTAKGSAVDIPLDIAEGRRWLSRELEESSSSGYGSAAAADRSVAASAISAAEGSAITTNYDSERGSKGERAIEIKKVWFRYGRDQDDVLKDMTLKIPKGQTLAIAGGNGAGKSTLLSLICGSIRQYRGKVSVRGSISKLPQEPQLLFTEERVEDELKAKGCTDEMIKLFELDRLIYKHPYDLSGGEQQRLALCEIFSQPADILLLDEPTKGLDPRFRRILEAEIKNRKEETMVIVSHDMEFCARCADACSMIFGGSITVTDETRAFLSGNMFYTTQINRMAGRSFPDVMLPEELADKLAQLILPDEKKVGQE